MSFRCTVPGNLLLAGEYILLEEGGLGAAIAVEPRLVITVYPAEDWQIHGFWPGGEEFWNPEQNTTSFVGQLFLKALERLEGRGDERDRRWSARIPPAHIEIDSSGFFDAQGRKRGFGSSAALAVAVTATLARLQQRHDLDSQHQIAIDAHRWAQKGAGSGYDVTASFYGGLGLFTGGPNPTWQAFDASRLPALASFAGPQAIKTTSSISLYQSWKTANPSLAHDWKDQSNAAVRQFLAANDWSRQRQAWEVCRQMGLQLGQAVGSDAQLFAPPSLGSTPEKLFCKALGAGNETGLLAGLRTDFPEPLPSEITLINLSPTGLEWDS